MKIMFDDLTHEAQERLLKEAGVSSPDDMFWDIVPVAIVEIKDSKLEDQDDVADDFYGFSDPLY